MTTGIIGIGRCYSGFKNRGLSCDRGIRFELVTYINGFERQKAATLMIILLVVVTIIDAVSRKLRQKLESL